MLINSWLASAPMWAVILRQKSVAVFTEREVGTLLGQRLHVFVRVELSVPHPSIPFFLLLVLPGVYKGGTKVG